MKTMMSEENMIRLRKNSLLNENEIAYSIGDLVVAENVTTGEKRVLENVENYISEGRKRILKG